MDYIDVTILGDSNPVPQPPRFIRRIGDGVPEIVDRLAKRRRAGETPVGLSTGIQTLDDSTDGLEPGDFYLMGSTFPRDLTGLSLQIAIHVASNPKHSAAILSYHHSESQLVSRIVCNKEDLDEVMLFDSKVSQTREWEKYLRGFDHLMALPLYIAAPFQKPFNELYGNCLQLRDTIPNLALIVIDDLQGSIQQGTQDFDGAEISQQLKEIAVETQTCVMATTQLPHYVSQRRYARPVLRDFHHEGRLDYYADVVGGLCRDSCHQSLEGDGVFNLVELILLKNTKGSTDTIRLIRERFSERFTDGVS